MYLNQGNFIEALKFIEQVKKEFLIECDTEIIAKAFYM